MKTRPIAEVAAELGIESDLVEPYGRDKAKIALPALAAPSRGAGRLVLVSAINPTPAGEGKTTTSLALSMAMRRLGHKTIVALREPSLGPVFGVKGGGTGGGLATLVPADDINLHFTGDIHAITSAHNLLSALVDNALHFRESVGDKGELDPRRVTWGRALDMNDRFLRNVIVGLGGKSHGVPRQERFDITAASEIMAIVALASGYDDLTARLGRIIVGQTASGEPVRASDLGAAGAMTALLRDALKPNLVQTGEGGPALVHAGPFANIAHGASSVLSTRLAARLGDFVITEAGFGFDLGGEKFMGITSRATGIWPRALVLVATLRALRMHGGAPVKEAGQPNRAALERGLDHLAKHLENAAKFGLPAVVAINRFPNDPDDEVALVTEAALARGARCAAHDGFARGGEGALDLARVVTEVVMATDANPPKEKQLYPLTASPLDKIRTIAREIYGATDVRLVGSAPADIERAIKSGGAELPICMAKTQSSLSDDPTKVGRPRDFVLQVREVRLAAGAGYLVAITGDMMTMPGLPRVPAARGVRLLPTGRIQGLMQGD